MLHFSLQTHKLISVLLLGVLGFVLTMALTPIYTTLAYKYKWWKKQRSDAWSGGQATVYAKLHAAKHKRNIPNMAGVVFIVSIAFITLILNLKRQETWLPLAGMVAAGVIGLADDVMNIRGSNKSVGGMRAIVKFSLYSIVGLIGGVWFYEKLGVHSIYLPWVHEWNIGFGIIILFWLVVVATANSVNISDGLDGLAGGLLSSSFLVYTFICGTQGKYILAGFCLTVVGAILSYTWFNIHPARFFMGDTGSFALGTALGIIAMQTDTVYILPIIGAVYVLETGSVIVNRLSKKLRHGKKVFLSSPIHHHFEALGWPETKVTMRFWIIGQIAAVVGLVVYLAGR